MNSLLCIALALIVGLLSSRLMKLINLPNVTGYLLAGILFGPYVLGKYFGWSLTNDTSLDSNLMSIISNIALGFIAFSIGSSFKFSALKSVGKSVIVITIFEALMAAVFVIASLFITKIFIKDIPVEIILTLGAISCATAPAATLMVIKQYKAKGPVVNTLLPVVAFDDAVALIAFSVLFSISKAMARGANPSFLDLAIWPTVSIILSLAVGIVLGILVTLGCKLFKSRSNRIIMCIAAIFVSIGLSIINFKSIIGVDISISGLLSSMMIGAVIVNYRKDSDKLFERMEMFTPPIFMLFFVVSGASLDITIFASKNAVIILIIALVYLVFRAVGKWVGAYSSATMVKAEPTVKKYLGFALVPQAGVAIGLASTASSTLVSEGKELVDELGNITEVGSQLVTFGGMILAIILASTIVYEIIGPIITKVALTKAGEIKVTPRQKRSKTEPTPVTK
ncbi:MAG: cation:proton antiporter [Gammaproteobacteria bacterium]|nr:cation:proton antiporter [Gammaproteobacteria bacterium]